VSVTELKGISDLTHWILW